MEEDNDVGLMGAESVCIISMELMELLLEGGEGKLAPLLPLLPLLLDAWSVSIAPGLVMRRTSVCGDIGSISLGRSGPAEPLSAFTGMDGERYRICIDRNFGLFIGGAEDENAPANDCALLALFGVRRPDLTAF